MKKRRGLMPGLIISAIFLAVVLAFMGLLVYTKLIPTHFMVLIAVILVILVGIVGALVWNVHNILRFCMGILLALAVTVVLIWGTPYIYKTTATLNNISGVNTEIAKVEIYVRANDTAQALKDTANYTYGVLTELDRDNTDGALAQLRTELGKDVKTSEYRGLTELVDGLLKEEVGAILLNTAYIDVIQEISGYENISSQIRSISVKSVETVIERKTPELSQQVEKSGTNFPDGEVFSVFISGIDTRGGMTTRSRSDVNIIATINTATREVFLVSTPRDYYVPLSISDGVPDKLTHAGIYGVNVCIDTLEMLYDTTINYYFRLNFAGFVNIINALEGIDVYSNYDFSVGDYHFTEGNNHVDGDAALAFCRERYSFTEGDRQRGKNQMAVINGVINKALSPDILKDYSSLLSGIEGSFETNIPYDDIATLVRQQLSEGGSWNVVSYSVDGTGDNQQPYSMSQTAYVMVPDYTIVDKAKELMKRVREGETVTQEECS